VAFRVDPDRLRHPGHSVCCIELCPTHAVVVVAQNAERATCAQRQRREDALSMFEDTLRFGREVAGVDDELGRERTHTCEALQQIRVGHLRADVQIAQLRHPRALQAGRQVGNRQRPLNDLQPVRLDAPSVETGRQRQAGRSSSPLEQLPTGDLHKAASNGATPG